jgi:hypothetical protein
MNWKEYSTGISAIYSENIDSFIGGDKTIKKIEKHSVFSVKKTTRRSFGASSHYNSEKLECNYFIENENNRKVRITNHNLFRRIIFSKLKIEGTFKPSKKLIESKELNYLMSNPNSEIRCLNNEIVYKTRSLGQMDENLSKIIDSLEIISNLIVK